MAKTTAAQLRAIQNYDKQHTTTILIKLNNKTDADLIEYLNASGNKQGMIKAALREYINKYVEPYVEPFQTLENQGF